MISVAGLNVAKIALVNVDAFAAGGGLSDFFIWKALTLAILIFVGQRKLKWNPIIFIAISAVAGIVFEF
jgi:chromate transporter